MDRRRLQNWEMIVILFLCFVLIMTIVGNTFTYLENKNKSLYEHCLDKCNSFSSEKRFICVKDCNEVFEKVALDFLDKAESILNNLNNKNG